MAVVFFGEGHVSRVITVRNIGKLFVRCTCIFPVVLDAVIKRLLGSIDIIQRVLVLSNQTVLSIVESLLNLSQVVDVLSLLEVLMQLFIELREFFDELRLLIGLLLKNFLVSLNFLLNLSFKVRIRQFLISKLKVFLNPDIEAR